MRTLLPKKKFNPFGREYIKVINRVSAVYLSEHTQRKLEDINLVSEKLEKYKEAHDCLIDTKQFRVVSNYNLMRQIHFMKTEKIQVDTKIIKKWCFKKTEIPIYKSIAISLDKNYISNFDSCYNFVVRVDKGLLQKYKHLDLVIKAKLIRI